MSRTTLDLDPSLIEGLKHMAARGRESMSRVANQLLREALQRRQRVPEEVPKFRWHTVPDGRPTPGFDPATRDYLDMIDEPT
ncbi:MAG: hypothetical protein ACE5HV_11675 [Acidobacteriota bacterium]